VYNESNTVHVDDLSRNFALNPQQGLKISAYKEGLKISAYTEVHTEGEEQGITCIT
ncbi:hypothetical protein T484DRAFT_1810442, partial [Baffinella frigidus]